MLNSFDIIAVCGVGLHYKLSNINVERLLFKKICKHCTHGNHTADQANSDSE